MIASLTVESNVGIGVKKGDVGTRLVNANYIHAAKTVQTSKTQFEYPFNHRDRREKPALLTTTDGIATVRAAANLAPTTLAITLPVHENDDVSVTAVNHDFMVEDIVWGLALPSDSANKSIVYILTGGFKVKKYIVDLTLAEIIALVTV